MTIIKKLDTLNLNFHKGYEINRQGLQSFHKS